MSSHTLEFPVYAAAFVNESEAVVTGGGGRGRSGVKNKLVRSSRDNMAMFEPVLL
jgi:hypothetical protein